MVSHTKILGLIPHHWEAQESVCVQRRPTYRRRTLLWEGDREVDVSHSSDLDRLIQRLHTTRSEAEMNKSQVPGFQVD
jgi:hypothetical protein